MTRTRYQFGLTLLTGFFLLATLFAVLLYALTPATPATRGPLLLTAFVAILLGTLVCILFFLRWVFRPYRQLVGEAEKAPIESRAPKSKDEAEFVLETFQSVVAQLQEQRKALEQLSKQASKRADSAERFSERIVASVPSALIAFDARGHSMAINAPGRALLGVDGSALGQPVAMILHKIPQLAEMVGECLKSGNVYRREEIETLTAEQIPRRLGATVAPIELSEDRGPRGALCLLTDITEVTQLREQVALKKNLESLGEMSAGLAHEFKNAIATLHGYVQLLQSLELDERARGTASSLLNEVRNLSEMVTSFLNFARPQPLQLDEVNLDELIVECTTELAPVFKQSEAELVITGTAGVSPTAAPNIIRADERMLRQALSNLIRNAAEAIPETQTDRRVEVFSSSERDKAGKQWAMVEIKDTGEGIPTADLERIFIPFFTTKASGHGIGLALAHRVITQHGGTLTAANAQGGGAVFSVRLPL
ncbi:MAG TPA: ATP-binding protein [Pyrinomonadaceae bacterium]|jgi:signal transduction histidine kinase|nr:ATP-binding protein [Pyrinomonadaceae bacterium]